MNKVSSQKGFTLIELLIVIVIIGILAASLAPSVVGLIGKGNDAAKISDIRNIQLAVESFYTSNGRYPAPASGSGMCVGSTTDPDMVTLKNSFKGATVPAPKNSIMSGCTNQYVYCKLSAPNNYAIGVQMENSASTKGYKDTADILTNCATATGALKPDAPGKFYWSVQ